MIFDDRHFFHLIVESFLSGILAIGGLLGWYTVLLQWTDVSPRGIIVRDCGDIFLHVAVAICNSCLLAYDYHLEVPASIGWRRGQEWRHFVAACLVVVVLRHFARASLGRAL